jgi:hypothetical protein
MFKPLPHLARVTTVVVAFMIALVPVATAGGYAHRSTSPSDRAWLAATCHHHQTCAGPSASRPVEMIVSSSADRFQWSSAAIGFGVACGAVLLATGVVLVRRRTRLIDAGTPRAS